MSNASPFYSADAPEAVFKALEAVKEWINEQGVPNPTETLWLRENDDNYMVRFEVPSIDLSASDIEEINGRPAPRKRLELLFRARLWLDLTHGHFNIYKRSNGTTCIDLVVRTRNRNAEKLLAEYRRHDALVKGTQISADSMESDWVLATRWLKKSVVSLKKRIWEKSDVV